MRVAYLAVALLLTVSRARAIEGTEPRLRLGASGGLAASLPIGAVRAEGAARDEVLSTLWFELEPLVFEIESRWGIAALVRFRAARGVDGDAVSAAIAPEARPRATGLGPVQPTLLQLGLQGCKYWGSGPFQPFLALAGGYATLGARYDTLPSAGALASGTTRSVAREHRHRGAFAGLGVGVRYRPSLHVFQQEVLLPIALQLHYVHNFWLSLERKASLETGPNPLLGPRPFLDFLGVSLTVGFLR